MYDYESPTGPVGGASAWQKQAEITRAGGFLPFSPLTKRSTRTISASFRPSFKPFFQKDIVSFSSQIPNQHNLP
jgi:hypothetical protein